MTPETEAFCARLEAVESDPIGAGLSNNRYRNPDGPEAAAKLREMAGEIERMQEALRRVIDAPMIDHSRPENGGQNIARAALGGSHG